jgi:hypothetical protein
MFEVGLGHITPAISKEDYFCLPGSISVFGLRGIFDCNALNTFYMVFALLVGFAYCLLRGTAFIAKRNTKNYVRQNITGGSYILAIS